MIPLKGSVDITIKVPVLGGEMAAIMLLVPFTGQIVHDSHDPTVMTSWTDEELVDQIPDIAISIRNLRSAIDNRLNAFISINPWPYLE